MRHQCVNRISFAASCCVLWLLVGGVLLGGGLADARSRWPVSLRRSVEMVPLERSGAASERMVRLQALLDEMQPRSMQPWRDGGRLLGGGVMLSRPVPAKPMTMDRIRNFNVASDSALRIKEWDKLEKRDREVDFLRWVGERGGPELNDVQAVLDEAVLDGEGNAGRLRRELLLERYSNDPAALAVIWKVITGRQQKRVWDDHVVENEQEIEFLRCVGEPGAAELGDVQAVLDLDRRGSLLERYSNDPEALAVIWKILTAEERTWLWRDYIVGSGQEIEFLRWVGEPGGPEPDDVQAVLGGEYHYRFDLLERYSNDPEAFAVIWKISTDDDRISLWDDHFVGSGQEIEFLRWVGEPGGPELNDVQAVLNAAVLDGEGNAGRLRRELLLERYSNNPAALAVVWKALTDRQRKRVWDNYGRLG